MSTRATLAVAGFTLHEVARALGGQIVRGEVLAPGPGHSRTDRSLSIKLSFNSPDGLLVHSFAGDDWRTCRDYVADRLGITHDRRERQPTTKTEPRPVTLDLSERDRIARAAALWSEGRDPRGTVVERYLASRGLELPDELAGAALRFHPDCPWMDMAANVVTRVPTMLAVMRSITTDKILAVHRTRLTSDGVRVDRRMLGPAGGAAVKLDADETVTTALTIGEGIETCLTARQFGFRPVWAVASAGAITQFPLLGGIETLTLLRERDPTSDRACHECGSRWEKAGREVFVVDPVVGSDLNDALREVA